MDLEELTRSVSKILLSRFNIVFPKKTKEITHENYNPLIVEMSVKKVKIIGKFGAIPKILAK